MKADQIFGYGGGGYWYGYYGAGVPGGGSDEIFGGGGYGSGNVVLTEFSGSHDASASARHEWSWDNSGQYEYNQNTPSGSHYTENGYAENGSYSILDADTGQVAYTGTAGSYYHSNLAYSNPYDNTGDSFATTFYVDMGELSPQIDATNWDSFSNELHRTYTDWSNWFDQLGSEFANELRFLWNDFGGSWDYYHYLVQDEINTFKSSAYGGIDGFLDSINPADHFWSIPDIGPVEGHEFSYTVGYVGGMAAGVGVQIGIGVLMKKRCTVPFRGM